MKNRRQDSEKSRAQQGLDATDSEPYKIGAYTPYELPRAEFNNNRHSLFGIRSNEQAAVTHV